MNGEWQVMNVVNLMGVGYPQIRNFRNTAYLIDLIHSVKKVYSRKVNVKVYEFERKF